MGEINYYARHNDLDIAGGFETQESRDAYVNVSKSNGHDWRACTRSEAYSCCRLGGLYQNHYENEKELKDINELSALMNKKRSEER